MLREAPILIGSEWRFRFRRQTTSYRIRSNGNLWTHEKPPSSAGLQSRLQFNDMLFRRGSDLKTIDARTSDVFERIQRNEAEDAALRAQIEGERQLRFLAAEIVGAAKAAPVIAEAIEHFAQAMRAPLPRGRAGGLARARSAWRYFDGTFMPESEKLAAFREEYRRFASGGRARAAQATRNADGTFAKEIL
jgi:hypothetical protein